jgi:hypothetical protein
MQVDHPLIVHLDYVLSCRVIAGERRRVLARALHERPTGDVEASELAAPDPERDAALARLHTEQARFRAHASTLHARLATSRLFDSGELAALRDALVDAVATIDAAASASLRAGRDGAHLAPVRR